MYFHCTCRGSHKHAYTPAHFLPLMRSPPLLCITEQNGLQIANFRALPRAVKPRRRKLGTTIRQRPFSEADRVLKGKVNLAVVRSILLYGDERTLNNPKQTGDGCYNAQWRKGLEEHFWPRRTWPAKRVWARPRVPRNLQNCAHHVSNCPPPFTYMEQAKL